jgi:hypothetical protein
MFTKHISKLGLAAAAGLCVLTFGLGVFTSTRAQADTLNSGRVCGMESAKNVSYFPANTTFTIKTYAKLYSYKCGSDSGRWDETITWLVPPIVNQNGGVLEAAP